MIDVREIEKMNYLLNDVSRLKKFIENSDMHSQKKTECFCMLDDVKVYIVDSLTKFVREEIN